MHGTFEIRVQIHLGKMHKIHTILSDLGRLGSRSRTSRSIFDSRISVSENLDFVTRLVFEKNR
jgi:hypothetical protein